VGDHTITAGGANTAVGGPNVSYSTNSKRFLVVWPTTSFDVRAQLVDTNGTPVGGPIPAFNHTNVGGAFYPAVTWNSVDDEFGVAYIGWSNTSSFAELRRVRPDGSGISAPKDPAFFSGAFSTDITFDKGTGHYLLGWSTPPGSTVVELDKNGDAVRPAGPVSSRVGTPTSFELSYNPVSGTVLAMSEDNNSYELVGLELHGNGTPIAGTTQVLTDGGGTKGSFYPRVSTRPDAKQWLISYARQFTQMAVQLVATSSSELGLTSSIQMVLDGPSNGRVFRPGETLTVAGWAVDQGSPGGSGIDAVHVWAFPAGGGSIFLGAITSFGNRSDIGGLLGAQFLTSGFSLSTSALAPGTYTISAFPHSTVSNAFGAPKSAVVTFASALPVMSVDTPGSGVVPSSFVVSGWAIDRFANVGSGVDAVHVWASPTDGSAPIWVGSATLNGSRPDVAAIFGAQFASAGFNLLTTLPAGSYRLTVYLHSTVSNAFSLSQTVDITVGGPMMSIDTPGNGVAVSVGDDIGGWAIDRGAAGGTGVDAVHVWAFPVVGGSPLFVGAASLGSARADVAAAFGGRYTNAGYNLPLKGAPSGQWYDLMVFAHSTATGTFNQAKTVRIWVR
jgi:hypothetical protein